MLEITKDNLIDILSDHAARSALLKAMQKEQGTNLPLNNRYADLAPTCTATPERLDAVVKSLLAYKHRFDRLLCELVFHPNMPESTLMLLLAKRCCISDLGHRSGPQRLLEQLAERFRYPEAVTTLALYYYSRPDYPTEAFAAFLREYGDIRMLRGNILRARNLPDDKQEIVREVFGELPAPPPIDVRPAAAPDAERVFELLAQFATSYQPSREAFDRSFPRLLEDEQADLHVACVDGIVVGYVLAYRLLTLFANGPIMEIQELTVDPMHRSKGVGSRLVSAVVEHAWQEDCVEVTVPTRRAGSYYFQLGFTKTADYYKLRRTE